MKYGLTLSRWAEGDPLLYTQNQREIEKAVTHFQLTKDLEGEPNSVLVIYFSSETHNYCVIKELNPIKPLYVLFALSDEYDNNHLHDKVCDLLESMNITTEKYKREWEELTSFSYKNPTANG